MQILRKEKSLPNRDAFCSCVVQDFGSHFLFFRGNLVAGTVSSVTLNVQLLSSGNRYLVRSDDMIETVYNDRGEIIKTKERRVFMLSDVLMCATVSAR